MYDLAISRLCSYAFHFQDGYCFLSFLAIYLHEICTLFHIEKYEIYLIPVCVSYGYLYGLFSIILIKFIIIKYSRIIHCDVVREEPVQDQEGTVNTFAGVVISLFLLFQPNI